MPGEGQLQCNWEGIISADRSTAALRYLFHLMFGIFSPSNAVPVSAFLYHGLIFLIRNGTGTHLKSSRNNPATMH